VTVPVEDPVIAYEAAVLGNIRSFLNECKDTSPLLKTYAAWPGRMVSPSFVTKHFRTWAVACAAARAATIERHTSTGGSAAAAR